MVTWPNDAVDDIPSFGADDYTVARAYGAHDQTMCPHLGDGLHDHAAVGLITSRAVWSFEPNV